jgi:hypothetical protein
MFNDLATIVSISFPKLYSVTVYLVVKDLLYLGPFFSYLALYHYQRLIHKHHPQTFSVATSYFIVSFT